MRQIFPALLIALTACQRAEPTPPADPAPQTPGASQSAPPADGRPEQDSPPPAGLDAYTVAGPWSHGNLGFFILRQESAPAGDFGCIPLDGALRSGAVKICEKPGGAEVNELQVENHGDRPVYLQAGDAIKGGQQDRTIAVDTILPARSGPRSIDAFCVEPGRWTVRQAGARVSTVATAEFESAPSPVATKEQKLAIRLEKSQEKVWEAGRDVNQALTAATFSLAEPKNSYVLAVEDPSVQKRLKEVVAALEPAPGALSDAVGAAFWVNGKFQNVEIYGARGLFRRLWPKLLQSAALEAISKKSEAKSGRAPSEAELRALLATVSGRKGKAEIRPEGAVVRVFEREQAVLFDTEAAGKLVHREILTR